jgi:hypothetical protein
VSFSWLEFALFLNLREALKMPAAKSAWPRIVWSISTRVALVSLAACVVLAAINSTGLSAVRVTALEDTVEPKDHNLPLVKQKEALPDYELIVVLRSGGTVKLGAKPDTSADEGLTWTLTEPVAISDIASIRLEEQDKLLSDAIAEVQFATEPVTDKGYEFSFTTERSFGMGVQAFFRTPMGLAIVGALFVAIVLVLISAFAT